VSHCEESLEEDHGFWEELKEEFFSVIDQIYHRMRAHHVSYQGISWILERIPPGQGHRLNSAVGSTIIPPVRDVQIIHYDEQHPLRGRNQRYRLTLYERFWQGYSGGSPHHVQALEHLL